MDLLRHCMSIYPKGGVQPSTVQKTLRMGGPAVISMLIEMLAALTLPDARPIVAIKANANSLPRFFIMMSNLFSGFRFIGPNHGSWSSI